MMKGDGEYSDGKKSDNYGDNAKFWEWGEFPAGQGINPELQKWIKEISEGVKTPDDLLLEDAVMYQKYNRAIMRAQAIWTNHPLNQKRIPPKCRWYMGPAGCGKSRWVDSKCPIESTYRLDGEVLKRGWWDNYDPEMHENMIVDDVDGNLKFKFALRLTDRYPMQVERRMIGPCPFKVKNIYFTSTRLPEEIWRQSLEDGENFEQWYRRVELWKYREADGKKTFVREVNPQPKAGGHPAYAQGFNP